MRHGLSLSVAGPFDSMTNGGGPGGQPARNGRAAPVAPGEEAGRLSSP